MPRVVIDPAPQQSERTNQIGRSNEAGPVIIDLTIQQAGPSHIGGKVNHTEATRGMPGIGIPGTSHELHAPDRQPMQPPYTTGPTIGIPANQTYPLYMGFPQT